jgi:translocation and assembly module TamA
VTERPAREVGLAGGYGTDDGARVEAAYRDRNLFGRGFDLQSSIRAGQERQSGMADVYLPPGTLLDPAPRGRALPDSVGVLVEHSTIENLRIVAFRGRGLPSFQARDA